MKIAILFNNHKKYRKLLVWPSSGIFYSLERKFACFWAYFKMAGMLTPPWKL